MSSLRTNKFSIIQGDDENPTKRYSIKELSMTDYDGVFNISLKIKLTILRRLRQLQSLQQKTNHEEFTILISFHNDLMNLCAFLFESGRFLKFVVTNKNQDIFL